MNRDVFLSILTMDSYNRGYGQGVLLKSGDSSAGTQEIGRKLGNATIVAQNITGAAQSAGFYAIAYEWNGERVISFRGTDFGAVTTAAQDVLNGWSMFTGFGTNSQASLARDFYRKATGRDFISSAVTVGAGSDIKLTGHSLGGALAGYVGSRAANDNVCLSEELAA